MLYSFKTLMEDQKESSKSFPIAIVEKCTLQEVVLEDGFVDFIYSTPSKEVGNKRVWTPSMDKVYPRDGEGPMEAYARNIEEYLAFFAKHMHIFVPEEITENFGADSYQEFAKKATELLNKHKDSAYINLKSIPDSNLLYSTFGKYPNYVEKWEEGVPTRLKYSDWELRERVNPWQDKQQLKNGASKDASDLV